MILSWATLNCAWPIRFAGTCSKYSNRAIPQLTRAAIYQARWLRLFRCPYQANVMKTFEAKSSKTVFVMTGTGYSLPRLREDSRTEAQRHREGMYRDAF